MPLSSINAGIASSQSTLTGAMAQRAYQQESGVPAVSIKTPEPAHASLQESRPSNIYATSPIGSQTGVAAYTAIMNPQVSTSMRIEA